MQNVFKWVFDAELRHQCRCDGASPELVAADATKILAQE
jgi:hypothetical protein